MYTDAMSKRDARSLTKEAQHEIRKQAIKLLKRDMKAKDVAEILEVSVKSVYKWKARYDQGADKALHSKSRGRPTGSGTLLSIEQQKKVQIAICDVTPEQLKMPFALWTREAVQSLIRDLFGLEIEIRTVGRYLKRWGFTPQRPVKRAYERNDKAVKKWMDEEYPSIAKKAAKEGAEIHWGDETGVKSNDHRGRGFAPKGKTPVLKHKGKAEKVNMISSVTNRGTLRFMIYRESFTTQLFIKFMKQLVRSASQKVYLIVDNLRVHHARVVKTWLAENRETIEVYYLPSYSPDLNPDEYLNCDLKTELSKKPERRIAGKFTETVHKSMRMLQNKKERVIKYFEATALSYIKSGTI